MDKPIHSGLSYSGINDLLISPLRYWARHIDAKREIKPPTHAMQFGSATHAAVLEPERFDALYCQQFVPPEGCLITADDLRGWMRDHGMKPKGSSKTGLVEQVQIVDSSVPIASVLKDEYDKENFGKVQFSPADWGAITGAASALRHEPMLAGILNDEEGIAEVQFSYPYRDAQVKGRMDWITLDVTLELKTLSTRNKEPFDKAVTKAIWFEGYYRQAYLYSLARSIQAGDDPPRAAKAPKFIFAYVESSAPFETRLRQMCPKILGEVNMLWERARIEVETAIDTYKDCLADFGADEKPWRWAQQINPLENEEFPALMYGG